MDSFMPLRAHHILLTTLLALTISSTTLAAGAPPAGSDQFLLAHNKARSKVGVGPLKWSKKLANDTSRLVRYLRDKQGCYFSDTDYYSNTRYGVNQFRVNNMDATPQAAVQAWMEKKKYYNHAKGTCAENHYCNSYQQVVWKKSTWVGCAQVKCYMEHVTLAICFYDPPGNVSGQKPY